MRIISLFLLGLVLSSCATLEPKTIPSWFYKLKADNSYELIGYGQGNTLKEAHINAKEDISQILLSKVDSSIVSKIEDYSLSIDNNTSTISESNTDSQVKVTSSASLSNVKSIKQEKLDGTYFVAVKYENLDLAYRVKLALGSFKCVEKRIDSYLSQTPLVKKITSSLGCALNFRLERKDGVWYLANKEQLFVLSDAEFEKLYSLKRSDTLAFEVSKNPLKDGDSFYFMLHSKKKGYITLLNVYENGIVTLLKPSTPIEQTLQVPAKESENYFEAGLVEEGYDTFDLYVAMWSEKPLDMSRFEYGDEELASSEMAYKFDELLQRLENIEYATLFVRTKQ